MANFRQVALDVLLGIIVAYIVNVFITTTGLVNTSTTAGSLIATLVPILLGVAVIFAALKAGLGGK